MSQVTAGQSAGQSLPRHFEGPQQSDASEDGEAEGRHDLVEGEDHLQQAAQHHEEIKPIEQRDKVALKLVRCKTMSVRSLMSSPGSPGRTSSAASQA